MLNYHQIQSQEVTAKEAIFKHYLTLGSHQSPYQMPYLSSFSYVTLFPETRFIVDEQKIKESLNPIVIPVKGRVRVNEQLYEPGSIIYNPKYIQQCDKNQPTFLFLFVEGEKGIQVESKPFEDNEKILLTSKITIRKESLKQGSQFEVSKRIFAWIESGMIELTETSKTYDSEECIYTKHGCGKAKVLKDTVLFILEEEEQQQQQQV